MEKSEQKRAVKSRDFETRQCFIKTLIVSENYNLYVIFLKGWLLLGFNAHSTRLLLYL